MYCVLYANGNNNVNDNTNNIFLPSKTPKHMFQLSLYQQQTIKNYQNFLANDLKDEFVGMTIKQKVRAKIQQMNKLSNLFNVL